MYSLNVIEAAGLLRAVPWPMQAKLWSHIVVAGVLHSGHPINSSHPKLH
jgi:hypothetical protein